VSVRIVSDDVWQGINVSMLRFRRKESLALEALPPMKKRGDSDHISLVGYDISVSVELVTEPNEQPYHHVYLNWEATSPSLMSDDKGSRDASIDTKDAKLKGD
jgi:hypothetical protein